jgi:hypothetical protein
MSPIPSPMRLAYTLLGQIIYVLMLENSAILRFKNIEDYPEDEII